MTVRKTNDRARASTDDVLEFVLSDASIDAYGDTICPEGWDLSIFQSNPIALFGHNPDFVIGKWENVRIERDALRGHLRMAPAGASTRIDEVRALVAAGVLRSCSVGFEPLQSEPLPAPKRGTRYVKQLLRECSLVSIPANHNALATQARNLGISDTTIKSILAQSKDATLAERKARAKIEVDKMLAKARAERARARRAGTADDGRDWLSLAGLSDAEQTALIRAKAEAPFAVPPRTTIWSPEPSLYFGDKPAFRKKGLCGW